MATLPFFKYTALGNDYILIEEEHGSILHRDDIVALCDRKFGLGGDGVLVSDKTKKYVRIFNSDGSEAEKSGNGLRIFAFHLLDQQYVSENGFTIHCDAGSHAVKPRGELIDINMGNVRYVFCPNQLDWIKADNFSTLTVNTISVLDEKFDFVAVDIGNPHCVILNSKVSDLQKYGPHIENHHYFDNKINVQFVYEHADDRIKIGVWERGSGHTLASGSSSTAAFSVANQLGLCDNEAVVEMEGGNLSLRHKANGIWVKGSVTPVAKGDVYIRQNNKEVLLND